MNCLFCQIAEKKIPSKPAFESAEVLGFHDIHPQAPVHVLFVPKQHVAGVDELNTKNQACLPALFAAANQVARELQIHEKGYRLVINCKSDGGQTVDHLHLHLLGGRRMTWPPG